MKNMKPVKREDKKPKPRPSGSPTQPTVLLGPKRAAGKPVAAREDKGKRKKGKGSPGKSFKTEVMV